MNVKTQIKAGNGGDSIIWGHNSTRMRPADSTGPPPAQPA